MKKKGTEMKSVMGSNESEAAALDKHLEGLDAPQAQQKPADAETPKERLARLQREIEEVKQIVEAEEDAAFTARIAKIAAAVKASGIDLRDVQAYIDHNGRPATWPSKSPRATRGTVKPSAPGEPKAPKADVVDRYRNPETGDTWSGRGKAPDSIRVRRIKFRNPANPSETWHGWKDFGQPPDWYREDLAAEKGKTDIYPDEFLIK